MPHSKRLLVFLGFAFPLLLLVTLGVLMQRARSAQIKSANWVAHTFEVEGGVASLRALLSEAESAQRGFLLTQDAEYLLSYDKSTAEILPTIEALKKLSSDSCSQQERLDSLAILLSRRR